MWDQIVVESVFFFFFFLICVLGQSSVSPDVPFPYLGDSPTITCNARGAPSQFFNWIREGQTVGNNSQYSVISFGSGSSQLTIKNVAIGDLGYYTCNATINDDQPNLAEVYVQVQCKYTLYMFSDCFWKHYLNLLKGILEKCVNSVLSFTIKVPLRSKFCIP